MAELVTLDALGPKGPYRSRDRRIVTTVGGAAVAELSMVPKLYVTRTMSALRKASMLPVDERTAALAAAGEAFANGTVDGLTVDAYQHLVARVSGMPIASVRTASDNTGSAVARAYESAQQGRPLGAGVDRRNAETRSGHAVWTRRGTVFAVHAAGNHPGVHGIWIEALALGYRVAVRPSRREPFTPHRLVAALRAAGFGTDQVVLLPTDYNAAGEIVVGADFSLVYGGDDVMAKYAHHAGVLGQGPGRSKILITADQDWREHVDTIVDSISHDGGTACVNTTAVLVEGDPAPLAEAIAERLAAISSLPPEDDNAVLPVQPVGTARALEKFLLDRAAGTIAVLGGDGVVDELGDGSAVLRPAVHRVASANAPQIGVELPFPCVWVAPWQKSDGVVPLRHSLVLTAITADADLLDDLLAEPSISNLYVGGYPTYWTRCGVPHDSYLSDFLMRSKAYIRD